jgi:hypothetical protein
VILNSPSILWVPLLCCLIMLLTNVLTVLMAAGDTDRVLFLARNQNVRLAYAVNLVYAQEETAMVEQRKLVESITVELQDNLVAQGEKVRSGSGDRVGREGSLEWARVCGGVGEQSTSGPERAKIYSLDPLLHSSDEQCVCAQLLAVLRMVELDVQQHPEDPYTDQNFNNMASIVMRLVQLPALLSIGLAPLGRTANVFPLAGNEGDIGLDSMDPCQVRCQRL